MRFVCACVCVMYSLSYDIRYLQVESFTLHCVPIEAVRRTIMRATPNMMLVVVCLLANILN